MKEIQTIRFQEQVAEIVGNEFTTSLKFNPSGEIIEEAKINLNRTVAFHELEKLRFIADTWSFRNMDISRSGAGLKVSFTHCQFTTGSVVLSN